MNRERCDEVQDRLAEFVAGDLDDALELRTKAHLDECTACAEAHEVVALIAAAPRLTPSHAVEARMRSAAVATLSDVRGGEADAAGKAAGTGAPGHGGRGGPGSLRRNAHGGLRGWRVPSWGLAAAAGVVLALGTPFMVERMQHSVPAGSDSDGFAVAEVDVQVQDLLPSSYVSNDPMIAGAPALDALSDEALLALLEEMEG